MCCKESVTVVIPIQQQKPNANGFEPVFTSFTIFVFSPTALIARMIKNLLKDFSGAKNSTGTPKDEASVVIMDAMTKYRMNIGKTADSFTWLSLDSDLRARTKANTSVMGMIANVRVNFTVTALSSVAEPSPYRESHVDAAAVTEEVSLTAVPAKIPNASPLVVEKPNSAPNVGKNSAASILKKKITEMDCATSSSFASITGAVAAIAEPPQMEEPTPTKVAVLPGTRSSLCSTNAMIRDVLIVLRMMGSDCLPVSKTTDRFSPNPKSTTAYCSIFLDVNVMPGCKLDLSFKNSVISIPDRIPKTGPPTMGNRFPNNQQGMDIAKHRANPFQIFLICVKIVPPFISTGVLLLALTEYL